MSKIVVIGEVLVEIMADSIGDGFRAPQPLTGPFPSGAPAIFADQVAKLDHAVSLVSCVGNDDFGRINLERLESDGVDISAIHIDRDRPTGSAFVRYRADGSRDFVFNIEHSACGNLHITENTQAQFDSASHVHVMGSSLSTDEFVAQNIKTAKAIKARGGTVSFDPNLRKEILDAPGMTEAMMEILAMTDLFLPSGDELTLLTQARHTAAAEAELFELGVCAIVHKNGADGARYSDANATASVAGFSVEEVDPTGAGDCFGGAFTACWLQGMEPSQALTLAAAAGALAVTKRGPMEGTNDLTTIQQFISDNQKAS